MASDIVKIHFKKKINILHNVFTRINCFASTPNYQNIGKL